MDHKSDSTPAARPGLQLAAHRTALQGILEGWTTAADLPEDLVVIESLHLCYLLADKVEAQEMDQPRN